MLTRALILFIQTLALYKSFTYLLTYCLGCKRWSAVYLSAGPHFTPGSGIQTRAFLLYHFGYPASNCDVRVSK